MPFNLSGSIVWLAVLAGWLPPHAAQAQSSDTGKIHYVERLLHKANAVFYSNPDSSYLYSGTALDYATKNKLPLYTALASLSQARTEVLRGDIEPAMNRLKNAVIVFEKHQRPEQVAKCYGLMSTALGKIHNTEASISFLLKAVDLYRQLNNTEGLKANLVNLANTYSEVKQFDKALVALNESKRYTKPGDSQWYFYYVNAGTIYMGQQNYALAKIQFDSCLVISQRYIMVDAEVTAITRLGDLYLQTKHYADAVLQLNRAVSMSRAKRLPIEESEALAGLLSCYESMGDYKNAFVCQNRLKAISDSLFNLEKIKNISTVEAKLKVSEKEKTIALQKLHMKEDAAEHEKSKKRIVLLIAGSSLLAIILFFTVYIYIKVRRQKREVELQKTRAERLNSLNQKIFAVIAHDFKSPMITLNMLMDLLDREAISPEDLSAYSADVRNQVTQSVQILDNLLNWAKTELKLSRITDLKASPFLIAGEIIKELGYTSARKNISLVNEIAEPLLLKVPPDILRIIIRNLVSNAVKFSFSNSMVTLGSEGKTVFVKDEGAGINEKARKELFSGTVQSRLGTFNETGFGLGLHITHELINKFNGNITIENNHPGGTVFKFVLPAYE